MSESVTLKSYFYEVLIPSSQKNTSSPIEDILHHVSISFMKKLALYKCFNPRTHTGCDTSPKNNGSYYDCFNPRTHTGCDFIRSVKHLIVRVSIHAPTRGATTTLSKVMCPTQQSVSIHAPTRGATLQGQIYGVFYYRFNPRTHTGCDMIKAVISLFTIMFQSTHPHGVRQCAKLHIISQ